MKAVTLSLMKSSLGAEQTSSEALSVIILQNGKDIEQRAENGLAAAAAIMDCLPMSNPANNAAQNLDDNE